MSAHYTMTWISVNHSIERWPVNGLNQVFCTCGRKFTITGFSSHRRACTKPLTSHTTTK